MSKLQGLNVVLTERLMLAAKDIYKAIEDIVVEYQEEIIRERRENDQLKRKLFEAGIACPELKTFFPLELEEEEEEDEDECFPTGQGNVLECRLTPEEGNGQSNDRKAEGDHFDCKSTFSPNGSTDYKTDPANETPYQEEGCTASFPEEDSLSGSPCRWIKAETEAPGACSLASITTAEKLTLQADCSPAQSASGVGGMETERLLLHCETVQFPKRLFQTNAAALIADPCRHYGGLDEQMNAKDRAFLCRLCGKSFNSSGGLKGHQRIHTGEKPYQCQICLKRFNQTAHLKVHLRVHTGEKPFSCPVCGKSFTQSNKVKRHLVTHTRD